MDKALWAEKYVFWIKNPVLGWTTEERPSDSNYDNYIPTVSGRYIWKVQALTDGMMIDSDEWNLDVKIPSSIYMVSPNGGESYTAGTSQNIKFNASGVDNVKLEYSNNSGSTWTTIIESLSATAGTYTWTVPNLSSTQCMVRVSDILNTSISDQNNATFTITKPESGGGVLLWKYQMGGNIDYSSPAIGTDGTVYVGALNKFLYATNPMALLNGNITLMMEFFLRLQ